MMEPQKTIEPGHFYVVREAHDGYEPLWMADNGAYRVQRPVADEVSFEEVVQLALNGKLDSIPGFNYRVCVAVYESRSNCFRMEYTGLVRRVREGKMDAKDFADFVRKNKDVGDYSPLFNSTKGLPKLAVNFVELFIGRAYAGVSARLNGSEFWDNEKLDLKRLSEFDSHWESMCDAAMKS